MYKFELLSTYFAACCILRIPRMRLDDACLTVALDVLILSWFDLLLLCTRHTHIHHDYWHKGEILDCGGRRTAATVLLLYCFVLLFLWLRG